MAEPAQAQTPTCNQPPGLRDLTKEEVIACPLRAYHGPVVLCETPEEAEAALDGWREPAMGFDLESRPSFTRGIQYPPALVQLAGRGRVVLVRLSKMAPPDALWALLEDASVTKVGAGLDRDVKDLQALRPFSAAGFLDLAVPAAAVGLKSNGLRNLAASVLGFRIGKGAQTSNWETPTLSHSQITYAATDAWVGLEIYQGLSEIARLQEKELQEVARLQEDKSEL